MRRHPCLAGIAYCACIVALIVLASSPSFHCIVATLVVLALLNSLCWRHHCLRCCLPCCPWYSTGVVALVPLASSFVLASLLSLCWYHHPHHAGIVALIMLASVAQASLPSLSWHHALAPLPSLPLNWREVPPLLHAHRQVASAPALLPMRAASQWKRRTCTHWQATFPPTSPPVFAYILSMEENDLLLFSVILALSWASPVSSGVGGWCPIQCIRRCNRPPDASAGSPSGVSSSPVRL